MNEYSFYSNGKLGSAGKLQGRTLVVSIYANDKNFSWDFSNKDDLETIERTRKNLIIATDWLTQKAVHYNSFAPFLCNWVMYPDLYYTATFDKEIVRDDGLMYFVQAEYVKNNIDSEKLKQKYGAYNIVYFFFFNTGYDNQIHPWALTTNGEKERYIEYTNIYVKFKNGETQPASYAHEILHTFGAPDLYYSNSTISQDYVDYCKIFNSKDIMYSVNSGNVIDRQFTNIDAYYVGLCKNCIEVDNWKLGESEHIHC